VVCGCVYLREWSNVTYLSQYILGSRCVAILASLVVGCRFDDVSFGIVRYCTRVSSDGPESTILLCAGGDECR
jgi:hypothetical protein